MSRALWGGLALLLLTGAGAIYWRSAEPNAARGYVTLEVDRGTIAASVSATGTVNPVTQVQVGTYVSGPIQAIYADFNAPVKKGQLVAKIDPAPFGVKVSQAEANLANARARVEKDRADLQLKKLTLERNRDLRASNLVSQNDVDTAMSNYDQAIAQIALDQAGVDQAQAALQEARINLAYTDITSPVDGVVVSRNVDVGQTVAASFQTPTLFLIAQDLTKMQVDAAVSESDIGDIQKDQKVTFSVDAYPERTFSGVVGQVRNAPLNVANVVTYDVVVSVDNSDLALKPGMTATVSITTQRRDDVVRIPLRALRFKPRDTVDQDGGRPTPSAGEVGAEDEHAVWRVQPDGSLDRVAVKLGIRNDTYGELLSDELQAGEQLAVAYGMGKRERPQSPPPFVGGARR